MPLYPFINGPRPPFPVPPIVGRVNTPPSGGAIPQRDFAIDDVESDWILAGPYHTEALQEAIAVARRICFSEFGIRMTAMALTVPWEDFPVGGASSPLLAVDAEVDPNAIAAVNDYQRAQCMTVVVDSMTRDDGAVLGNAPTELSINFQLIKTAAEARYIAMGPTAAEVDQVQYDRQIYYLAVVISHEIQHSIRQTVPEASEFTPSSVIDAGFQGPERQYDHEDEKYCGGEGGFWFEDRVLGGRTERVMAGIRGGAKFEGAIALSVLSYRDGALGQALLKDGGVRQIVRGEAGWEELLPIEIERDTQGWGPKHDPHTVPRLNDGSEAGRRLERRVGGVGRCGTH